MIKEGETTIYIPGGAKLATESDEARYSLTDHLNSTRLAVASDNEVSRATDYTPFGDTPSDTTLTAKAGRYTGQAYEPESATYDYHARAYDPTVARFTGLDRQREDASPYVYVGNNPIAFVDPGGGGKVPLIMISGVNEKKTNVVDYNIGILLFNKLSNNPRATRKVFSPDTFFPYEVDEGGSEKTSNTFGIVRNNLVCSPDEDSNYSDKLFWIVTDKEPDKMGGINLAARRLSRLRSISGRDGFASDAVIIDFTPSGNTAYVPIMEQLKILNGKDPGVIKAKIERGPKIIVKGSKSTDSMSLDEFIKDIDTLERLSDAELYADRLTARAKAISPITQAGESSVVTPPVTSLTPTTLSTTVTESVAGSSQSGVHGVGPIRHQSTLSTQHQIPFYQPPDTGQTQVQARTTKSDWKIFFHTYFPDS